MKNKIYFLVLLLLLLMSNISYANSNETTLNTNNKEVLILDNNEFKNEDIVVHNTVYASNVSSQDNNLSFLAKLATPLISTILLTVAIVAFVIEIFIPTFGIASIISVISFALFFGSNLASGNATSLNLIIFMIGVVLLAIEVIVPGFGLPGILGIIFVLFGVTLSLPNLYIGLISVVVALLIGAGVGAIIIRKGYKSKFIKKVILDDKIDTSSNEDYNKYLGKKGKTLSPLRPAGIIEIEGDKLDAISEGNFINRDTNIKVIKVEGFKIYVRSDN